MDFWDKITGKSKRDEQDAEMARQRAKEAQAAQEAALARQMAQRPPDPIQRAENQPRPGERLLPQHVDRQRDMHDHPREPQKPEPDRERKPTELEYTMTPQPAPTIATPGISTPVRPPRPIRPASSPVKGGIRSDETAAADAIPEDRWGPTPDYGAEVKPAEPKRGRSQFPDHSKGRSRRSGGDGDSDDQA